MEVDVVARKSTLALVAAFVAASVIALVDWIAGGVVLIGLLVVAPLVAAALARWRETALAGAYAVALSLLLGLPDDDFGSVDHLLRVLVVLVGSGLAIWISWLRARSEEAEARSKFVADASAWLDTSLDFETTADTLSRLVVPWLADWAAVYAFTDAGTVEQVSVAHSDPAREKVAWELHERWPFHLEQPAGAGHVMRTGRPQFMHEVPDDTIEASSYDREHADMVRSLGVRSAMFLPLRARGRTLGALAFATAESGRLFSKKDLALAESFADRAALALDNAQLHTQVRQAEAELRQSVEEVQAVLQGIASAITVQDEAGNLVYANDAAARLLGFESTEELLDTEPGEIMRKYEVFDENGRPVPLEELPGRRALAGEQPGEVVLRFRTLGGGRDRWSVVRATPVRNEAGEVTLAINIFDDITRQKRGELAERFLSEGSRVLGSSIDFEATLDNVAHLAVPQFADWCAVDLADPGGALRSVAVAHADPSKIEMVEDLRRRYPPDPDAAQGVPQVVRTGEAQFIEEVTDEMLAEGAHDNIHLEMIHSLGLRSAIIAPMTVGGRVIGAMTFCTAESNHLFDEQDLEVAKDLAQRAGTAVENARLYSERAHIARTLQRSLLPPVLPDIPGMEVAARFRPAGEGYEVGGDFYDVFNTGAGGWALVIGDVCGKGPEAAALTGLARHTLRAAAMQETDPSRVLSLLSEAILRQSADSQFCTAAFARLELRPVGASLTVSSGGHPLPFLVTEDGRVTRIGEPGTLLGSVSNGRLTDHEVELVPGASLVFYTDGVIEAGRPRGSFGEPGLASLLETCAGLGAQEIAERIDKAVMGIEGKPADDVAVLVLRVRE